MVAQVDIQRDVPTISETGRDAQRHVQFSKIHVASFSQSPL